MFHQGVPRAIVATIPVGSLPHGIWPSGDGSRIYVALENGTAAPSSTRSPIESSPTCRSDKPRRRWSTCQMRSRPSPPPRTLCARRGRNTASLHLGGVGSAMRHAQGWVAVNSLGLLDLVQIAAEGLTPKTQYRVFLSEVPPAPSTEPATAGRVEDEPGRRGYCSSHRSVEDARCARRRSRCFDASIPDRQRIGRRRARGTPASRKR